MSTPRTWYATWTDDGPRPVVYDLMGDYPGAWCGADWETHQGEICTRLPGHTGRHAAADGNGNIIAVWEPVQRVVCVCGRPPSDKIHVSRYVTGLAGHQFVQDEGVRT